MSETNNQPSQPENNPALFSVRKNHWGSIVIALLVLGVVAGGLWLWQVFSPIMPLVNQPQGNTDWKFYVNSEYGFQLTLADSWKGYTVIADKWQGYVPTEQGDTVTQTGPEIFLRHPQYDTTREEIPVMILTPAQWQQVVQEKLSLGAAPIPPSLLGQNDKYVFALPARYNYGFNSEEAYTDADNIVKTFKLAGVGSLN